MSEEETGDRQFVVIEEALYPSVDLSGLLFLSRTSIIHPHLPPPRSFQQLVILRPVLK